MIVAFLAFKSLSFFVTSYVKHRPVSSAAPNELTRQFCFGMKTMAKQVKEGRASGMTQADYKGMIADIKHKFTDSPNSEQVVHMSNTIIKAAWLSSDDPQTFSEIVHETCLETIVLVP